MRNNTSPDLTVYAEMEKEALPQATAEYGARNGVEIEGHAPGRLVLQTYAGKYDLTIKRFGGEYRFAKVPPVVEGDEVRMFFALPGMETTAETAVPHSSPKAKRAPGT